MSSDLRFTCPSTGAAIKSDFSLDPQTYGLVRNAKVPVTCPHCRTIHEFRVGDGTLTELPLAS